MQIHQSTSLIGLPFSERYGLLSYTNPDAPLIQFGLYNLPDLDIFLHHRGPQSLIFQGGDARDLSPQWADLLKTKPVRLIAISRDISQHLAKYDLPHEIIPAAATPPIPAYEPPGKHIYFYSSDRTPSGLEFYGHHHLAEIKRKTGLIIIETHSGQYNRNELHSIYKECFVGLRLTQVDGLPNTNLQLGLMGRPCVFNGEIPGSQWWDNTSDIVEAIRQVQRKPWNWLPEAIRKYIDITIKDIAP